MKNVYSRSFESAPPPRNISRSKGFTLAEVLITLGIIGVVAAMTMPSLVANYQKKATASKVKKLYTNFNQAIKLAENEYGEFEYWEISSSEKLYEDYLKKHIKTIKTDTNIQISGSFTNGYSMIFPDSTQVICSDKINGPDGKTSEQTIGCIFLTKIISNKKNLFDYNNIKGTRNVFWFFINNKTGLLEPPYLDKDYEFLKQRCYTKNLTGNSYYTCSTILYKNNWEFPADYPW